MTTDRGLHVFSRKAKNHSFIPFNEIEAIEEQGGRFSTLRLIIKTTKKTYTVDYLSPRKAFGINEIKRRIQTQANENEMETTDEFAQRITILHRIQRYLGKMQTYSERL